MDSYQTSSPASIPHLILELLKCEPDEPQVQAKIMAYLQQEQANRSKHEKLSTFGLMCKMADQTLFYIVEWARSSVFFRELKVCHQLSQLTMSPQGKPNHVPGYVFLVLKIHFPFPVCMIYNHL
jgi:nuclear receptor subfamily 5 group A protein 2